MDNNSGTTLVFDAHLDLSMNALEWNRDLRSSVEEIRASERGLTDKPDRGNATVSFDAMRAGGVGLCVATQIARYVAPGNPLPGWHSQEQAWAQTQGQMAWYRAMERDGQMMPIADAPSLRRHRELWENASPEERVNLPIGYILSIEGADSFVSIGHLETAYEYGLRAVGPAHYGPGVYANGTDSSGGMPRRGIELLARMDELGMILDVTHLNDECFRVAMDRYRGPVWASHNACRSLVDHNRQFSDEMIRELVARGAVIGVPFDAWMLVPHWIRGASTPRSTGVTLESVVDNIDRICQLAGDASHAGLGPDLDGGFGTEQCPSDVDTIADLQKIPALLVSRGYSQTDIDNILHANFIRFVESAWS